MHFYCNFIWAQFINSVSLLVLCSFCFLMFDLCVNFEMSFGRGRPVVRVDPNEASLSPVTRVVKVPRVINQTGSLFSTSPTVRPRKSFCFSTSAALQIALVFQQAGPPATKVIKVVPKNFSLIPKADERGQSQKFIIGQVETFH